MVMAAFYFSVMSILVKTLGRRLPSNEIVFARSFVSLIAAAAMVRRAGVSPWGNRRGLLVLRGCLGFIGLVCFFYSITHLPLAEATVIQYTNPVLTGLLASAVLGERARPVEVVGVLGCVVGVVVVTRPALLFGEAAAGYPRLAVAAAVLGAIISALAYVVVRKLGETEHPSVTVFYFALIAVPASIPLMWSVALLPTPGETALLLVLGLVTLMAQTELTRGLQLERAGRAMSMAYLQIVFAVLWGVAFFGEIPDALAFTGMGIIVASTALVSRGGPTEVPAGTAGGRIKNGDGVETSPLP